METKRIVITGSLGYIGTVLVPYLTRQHHDCIGYDVGFFRDCTLYPPEPQRMEFKDARDITVADLRRVDSVVHLAGVSNDPFGKLNPHEVYDPTLTYSLRLASLCKDHGVRFIFASSCSIYGKASEEILTEDSPPNPQSPYSLNKLQIEDGLRALADSSFSPIMLRFATVYGPSPRPRFDLYVNMFAGMILTTKKIVLNSNGKAWRPNVHITDVLKAINNAIEYQGTPGTPLILNVGDTHDNYQVIDIAQMFTETVPGTEIRFLSRDGTKESAVDVDLVKDQKIQDGVDKRTYKVSFEKIKKIFPGYSCSWRMREGIQDLLATLESHHLTSEQFNNINYYRLQKYENLFQTQRITKDLHWIHEPSRP